MELSIEEFDINIITQKNLCLILGDNGVGKSTLIKHIIFSINNTFSSGTVFTDTKHFNSLYSLFLNEKVIYKRYSTLLANRCFINNTYIVLDNYYNKEKYTEIFNNCKNKNILLLISLLKITDFKDYDYLFLCKFTDIKEIYKIYKHYIQKFKELIILEQFIELINYCTVNHEILIINCKAKLFNELFLSYTFNQNKE